MVSENTAFGFDGFDAAVFTVIESLTDPAGLAIERVCFSPENRPPSTWRTSASLKPGLNGWATTYIYVLSPRPPAHRAPFRSVAAWMVIPMGSPLRIVAMSFVNVQVKRTSSVSPSQTPPPPRAVTVTSPPVPDGCLGSVWDGLALPSSK